MIRPHTIFLSAYEAISCATHTRSESERRTSLIALFPRYETNRVFSRRYPNHAAFSPALNSLITTLAASLFSPFIDLAPSDAILARATSNAFPFPSRALMGSFTYHGFHAGSHPESGYDSVVRPALPSDCVFLLSRSLSLSLVRPFSSLVPPHPLRLAPPHPPAAPSPIYREEVSHTTDSRQFSHLESQNFSLLPLSPPSPHPSTLSGLLRRLSYPRYIRVFLCISFPLVPSLHTHLPSSSYSRLPARSLLPPLVPREHVREVRFPLASLSLPPRQPALVLLVLFAPFRFTTGAGRLCPSSPPTAPRAPLLALPSVSRARPLRPSLASRPDFVRSLPPAPRRSSRSLSPTVSSSVRCTSLSISLAAYRGQRGQGVRFYKWFQPRTGAGVVFRVIGRRLCHAVAER